MNQEEVWKKIEDYPEYEVSNRGNVRNIKSGKILKQTLGATGYYSITLYRDNKKRKHYIHKLIAIYFIDNPNNCTCVGHIDDNKLNNNIQNLRWQTKQQKSMMQRKTKSKTTSIYKGVAFSRRQQKWQTYICKDYKCFHIGYFDTELEGARAYDEAAKQFNGEFVRFNLKEDEELTEQLANLNINEDKQE